MELGFSADWPSPLKRSLLADAADTIEFLQRSGDRFRLVIGEAVMFLDRRRDDGIDFPYDSRPLRKLREVSGAEDA